MSVVELDVGGVMYKTTISTLTSVSETYFSRMFSGDWQNARDSQGRIFIDRKGALFDHILEFLRNGTNTVLPDDDLLLAQIRLEAQFYCLAPLVDLIDQRNAPIPSSSEELSKTITLRFCERDASLSGVSKYDYHERHMTLEQMQSVPGSYFAELANNISNNTLDRDRYATWFPSDDCYYIKYGKGEVHDSSYTPYIASLVCEVVIFGFAKCVEVYRDEVSSFYTTAKDLRVPAAIELGWDLMQKWGKFDYM